MAATNRLPIDLRTRYTPAMLEHSFPFDPTYGYSQADLLAICPPAIPLGFAEFWKALYQRACAIPPRPILRPIRSPRQNLDLFELEYDGLDGFRVGGWLTRPAGQPATRGVIASHGYGGREAPDLDLPGPPAVAIFPCARGFHRSARPDLPPDAGHHVIHGIDSPQSYIHGHCVADLWCAVSALLELAPETAGRIDFLGTSFGGGMGAMAVPWEPRFRRGFLGVPSFGHHDLRLKMTCVGSGESVRQLLQQRPEIRQTLYYFDSAVAARFCTIPMMVACALFDPAVPPPGQFAVYNAIPASKRLFISQADHFDWAGASQQWIDLFRDQHEWFMA